MDILKHFDTTPKGNFRILTLKDVESDNFSDKLPKEYLDCLISKLRLSNKIEYLDSTREQEVLKVLPTNPSIMSGDFGEILAYFIFKEKYKGTEGPKKWRWKEDKDKRPSPYSDVVLFSTDVDRPSENDLLISIESKSKPTRKPYSDRFLENPKKDVVIQNSINDAHKDYVSRLAKTLPWVVLKYEDEITEKGAPIEIIRDKIKKIKRFIDAEIHTYHKKTKAIVFLEKGIMDYEIGQNISLPTESEMDLEVYIVEIKDLKQMYEKVYSEMPKS